MLGIYVARLSGVIIWRIRAHKFVMASIVGSLKLMDRKLREEVAVKGQRIRRLLSEPETLKKVSSVMWPDLKKSF